jgi:hypothetical protein
MNALTGNKAILLFFRSIDMNALMGNKAILLFFRSIDMNALTGNKAVLLFFRSIDMNALMGNAQNQTVQSITTNQLQIYKSYFLFAFITD